MLFIFTFGLNLYTCTEINRNIYVPRVTVSIMNMVWYGT